MKTLVFMFDCTGIMAEPWAEAGYQCYCYDIKNETATNRFHSGGAIHFRNADLTDFHALVEIERLEPLFVFGFPPCTDLAVSGAKHFKAKGQADPGYRDKAMSLVYSVVLVARSVGCGWMFENPVSVISTEYRKFDYKFHPHEYGGYLPLDDVHPEWPEYIQPRDAYPKLTCLWTSNDFIMPEKKRVNQLGEDVPCDCDTKWDYSKQFYKLGGKSEKTKTIRSATPRGFARAVYLANKERMK